VKAGGGATGQYSLSSTAGTLTKKTDSVHTGELTGSQQLYELTVQSTQSITLSAGINALSQAATAYLEIYDSQGNSKGYAYGGSGVSSYAYEKINLAAGSYVIGVKAGGGVTGKYSLSSTAGVLAEMPLNQVFGHWAPSPGKTFSSVNNHRYGFGLNGPRFISLSVASQGNSSNNTIYILNSQKQVVVEQQGTATGLTYEGILASGAYEIIVTTANAGDSGTFELSSRYVNFDEIEPSVSVGVWTQSGGMDYSSAANQIKQIEVAAGTTTIIGVEAEAVQPYIFLLDSSGQKVAQSGVGYDPKLAEISMELPAGTYYVVAATAATGVSGDFEVKLIGGLFSAFVPHNLDFDVPGVETSQDAVDINITIPIAILGGIKNVVFSYVVNGVSYTLDLAALGCTIGEPCTISIDTQDLDLNASISWRLTAEILEDGVWVNSEVANAQTLVNLDLLVLDDFKTDTYYVPVTVKLLDPVLHSEYENFRLKYWYLQYSNNAFEEPITALTNQEQIFTIDGSYISKLNSDYEDTGKLLVQVIADKKANGGNAAVNDVILDSSEKTYDIQPLIKRREVLSTDGVFRFSALIPHSVRYPAIYYTPENENYEVIRFDAVKGPELVDYEIYLGNAGRLEIGLRGLHWPINVHADKVLVTVNVAVLPEFTLTATNRDRAAIQNGTVAKAKWNAETVLESYCADPGCLIKLQYRMLDDSGVATPWKSYLLDERHETMSYIGTERVHNSGTGSESLWFDNIESGIVEAKLVAQYTMPGETEVTTSIIVEGSVVVAPTTTFIAPNNTQLPDVPTEWLYSINPQSSTDTQYDVSMNWPVANYDTFTVEQFIDGSWQLLYNGSVNAWSGTMSNLAQAGEVKLKLTSCQGGTCNETSKD
ncbi:MAG: hypothetical protein HRT35_35965, partial [Algicola sp.]|nr:hypothetical protein [Algicola sp.]